MMWLAVLVPLGLLPLGLLGLVLLRRRSMLVTVEGNSMAPAFFHGDRLVVRRLDRFAVGDIVVFKTPPSVEGGPPYLVKRVAAVAGDPTPAEVVDVVAEPTVPTGRFVVLGDNLHSLDSRRFGSIATDLMIGVVVRRLSPAA